MRRHLRAAIAVIATLTAAHPALADYSFSTTSDGAVAFDGPGNALILTGQPPSQALNFTNLINIQDVEIATVTTPPNLINVTVPFTFTLSIVQFSGFQPSTPGSGSVVVTGSLNITRSDFGGELSSLVFLTIPSLTIGNTTYTFSGPQYAAPTVNSLPNSVGAGNLSIQITPTLASAVPEPSSMALTGLGAALGLVHTLRRRRVASV